MAFWRQFFTWWNGQTLGTRFFTWRKGEFVGADEFGNKILHGSLGSSGVDRGTALGHLQQLRGSLGHSAGLARLDASSREGAAGQELRARQWEKPHQQNLDRHRERLSAGGQHPASRTRSRWLPAMKPGSRSRAPKRKAGRHSGAAEVVRQPPDKERQGDEGQPGGNRGRRRRDRHCRTVLLLRLSDVRRRARRLGISRRRRIRQCRGHRRRH